MFIGGLEGSHNEDIAKTVKRLQKGRAYENVSTVIVIPTRGMIPARVCEALMGLIAPPNQGVVRFFIEGMEVGEAYNWAVRAILENPGLQNFKYMLTVEEDNLPPPDGLLKLIATIADPKWSAVGGLYYTKGEEGVAQIWGDPTDVINFRPQVPIPNTVQETHGLGMGFTLFDLNVFRDDKIPSPWFKTQAEWSPETGSAVGTQDLYFCKNARVAGHRFAVDTNVRVGHLDTNDGRVW